MLPPREGLVTRCKCPVIGCESFMKTTYEKSEGCSILIIKCPECGYKTKDDGLRLPLISKSYGICKIAPANDVMVLCDEHHCKICNDTTVTFVFPEKMTQRESIKKCPCCNTFSCYVKLVTMLENGEI